MLPVLPPPMHPVAVFTPYS